nr:MAG: hypothetical protein AM325_06705 [Candidatus Thorarchaeota archaeon SMTZ1-45]
MESGPKSRLDSPSVRFGMMILVVILLNFGFFFILNFLTPLVTGVIVGFMVARIKNGITISFIGTIFSYFIVFLVSEWLLSFRNNPLDVAIAILIMGLIGAAGGLIGSIISIKIRK